MSLTPSQVEDFTRAFFLDHRLPVPRIRFCSKAPRLDEWQFYTLQVVKKHFGDGL